MLTIITGTPGAGKTLWALSRIEKETIPEKGQQRRPIFVHNIPDFDYQYFKAQELKDPDLWYECPHGSLIVFDEAQSVFPQRTKDDKPRKVEEFATHRHKGFDIFIITQDPMNVDVFVRRMCGRHFHIKRIMNRGVATVYEYPEYKPDPTGYHEKAQATSISTWKYPKKLFEKYKSATVHTHKARLPLKALVLPLALVVTVWAFWSAYNRISGRADEVMPSVDAAREVSAGNGLVATRSWDVKSAEHYLALFKPVIRGLQHSAPFYDELFEAKTFPKPHCIEFQRNHEDQRMACRCYTQQMTHYDTSEQNCRYWVRRGWFDPTRGDPGWEDSGRGEAQPPRALASNAPGH